MHHIFINHTKLSMYHCGLSMYHCNALYHHQKKTCESHKNHYNLKERNLAVAKFCKMESNDNSTLQIRAIGDVGQNHYESVITLG